MANTTPLKQFSWYGNDTEETVLAADKQTAAVQLTKKFGRQVNVHDVHEDGYVHSGGLVLRCSPPEEEGYVAVLDLSDSLCFALPPGYAKIRLPDLNDFDLGTELGQRNCALEIRVAIPTHLIPRTRIWWKEPDTRFNARRELQWIWRPLDRVLREWEDEGPEE